MSNRYFFDLLRDGEVSVDLVGMYASNSKSLIGMALDHGKRAAALAEQSGADGATGRSSSVITRECLWQHSDLRC